MADSRSRFCRLAGQLIEREPLPDDALHDQVETFRVGHLAIVETAGLFVELAEQMERFD